MKKKAQNSFMDKKLHEITNLCVEIINTKRQVNEKKLGHVAQIRVLRHHTKQENKLLSLITKCLISMIIR